MPLPLGLEDILGRVVGDPANPLYVILAESAVVITDQNGNPVGVTGGALNVAGQFLVTFTPPASNVASTPIQTLVGASSSLVLAANAVRKACGVKNTGTTVIYLGLGAIPTVTAYHIALGACGVHDDGSSSEWSGSLSGVVWTGAIYAISSSSGGTCVVTELT